MKIISGFKYLELLTQRRMLVVLILLALTACGSDDKKSVKPPLQLTGEQLFKQPFPKSNGRSCATCHVPEDNFTLSPEHVARMLETNPNDPLFAAIDADDPTAAVLTFEHLKKGLVRVPITLPNSMDVIDEAGNVITPGDRTITVWRSVPSIADSAITAPYQLDGRMATLEEQAQGAITGHSEGGTVLHGELKRIADFQRDLFTSDRSRSVAKMVANGINPKDIPDAENELVLSPEEARGRVVYEAVCAACHGGVNKTTIVDRNIHALSFPALKPDGTVLYEVPVTELPTPVLAAQPHNEFINIGSAAENYLVQIEATEHLSFTKAVSFPQYRFRFYADATRTQVIADLPPALPTSEGNPDCDGNDGAAGPGDGGGPGDGNDPDDGGGVFGPVFDADCNPVTGPNFTPQLFTTDPGRAVITGNPYDFEAFDIPTLRGIAKTAPYWHNNISETLEGVVELYSDHLLAKYPSLTLEGEKEVDEDDDTGPEETMTRQQKDDLVAYLKRL